MTTINDLSELQSGWYAVVLVDPATGTLVDHRGRWSDPERIAVFLSLEEAKIYGLKCISLCSSPIEANVYSDPHTLVAIVDRA